MNYSKNTKLIILGVVSVLIIAVALIFSENRTEITSSGSELIAFERKIASLEKDSDGDGIKDWEEELVGFDPYSSDTDGDGVLDGDEFSSENFDYSQLSDGGTQLTNELLGVEEGNLTQNIAREVFIKYMEANQGDLSTLDQDDLINSILSETNLVEKDVYTLSDLNIDTDTSDEAIHKYGDTLMEIFLSYEELNDFDLTLLFDDFVSTNNQVSLEKISLASDSYRGMSRRISLLSVPKSLSVIHLSILNTHNNIGVSLLGISKVGKDGLLALLSLSKYQNNVDSAIGEIIKLSNIFKDREILFVESESGYLWNSI